MEDSVLHAATELMSKENMNREQCRLDIAAIAYNSLPPRYVVTSKGASYARADLLKCKNTSILSVP